MTAFKPMLAKDGDLTKVTFPLAVQNKLDGIRCAIVDGRAVSRTLKPIPNAAIREALERPEYEGFDGEILVGDPTAADAYRRTSSFVMAPNKTGEPWAFHVFDLWNKGDEGFIDRFIELRFVVANVADPSYVKLVEHQPAADLDALEAIEAAALREGREGVIARVPHAPYKFGRSGKTGPLLKVKRFVDFEARVVGVYEQMHNANEAQTNLLGRTERSTAKDGLVPAGVLGGLVLVAVNGPAEGVEFRCGTGFDAAERMEWWREWSASPYIGRLVKVKSFPIGVKDKPRHPVYVGVRSTIDL